MERINALEIIVMFKSFGKTGKNHHHTKESKMQEIIKVWQIGGQVIAATGMESHQTVGLGEVLAQVYRVSSLEDCEEKQVLPHR